MEAHWKITILVNNYAREKDFKAEHGLSLLIEDEKSGALVLLDAGQSGDVLLHNARVLGIDWSRLTAVVLSHGHFDHTGGLAAVFESLDKPVPLLHHPDAFLPKAAGSPALHSIGTKPLVSAKALAFPSRNDTPLSDNLWITGEIPRTEAVDREASAGFFVCKDGTYREDPVPDDRSVVLRSPGKGFFLVSGCCHSGLINTLRYVKGKEPVPKLLGLLGGLHLVGASGARLEATIRELKAEAPDFIAPIHCSGQKETAAFYREFGDKVRFLAVGDVISL